MLRRLLPLTAAAMIFSACQAQSSSRRSAPAPATINQWSGAYGGAATAGHREVRDAAGWVALWKDLGRDAPRPFDPAREMAVALFIGERRSGGFGLEVVSAAPQDGKFVVTYRETTPPAGSMVTQALTAPWLVLVFPRSDLPLAIRPVAAARPVTPSSK